MPFQNQVPMTAAQKATALAAVKAVRDERAAAATKVLTAGGFTAAQAKALCDAFLPVPT